MTPLIELEDVYKIYQMGDDEIHAADGVSLKIYEGEFVAIVGKSGSFKTTLLLLFPINGIIHLINTDINAVLPMGAAIILVILSVILTLIGGLIPSKQAAKKDPVLALRSE